MEFVSKDHIENRRLFNAAAGAILLDEWEREHVHECPVCQGVFFAFLGFMVGEPSNRPAA